MGALPRPDVAPGPHRELVDELHRLHHRAGWPSLRTLARETGVSHTTVSKAMSGSALPPWGTVELLVEAMDGDVAAAHRLWLAASAPAQGAPAPAPAIAGRRRELAVVRRHLLGGTGLLLVTGEAGIGKTKLVTTAAATTEVLVATGQCLPLSTVIPLLPVEDLLRAVHGSDDGTSLARALARCPSYVAPSLSALLPEIGPGGTAGLRADDRSLLFTAVALTLRALAAERPVALVVEDLHWSDPTTLDLLEHLVSRSAPVPVVATWRSGDPDTPATGRDWLARVRRLPATSVVELEPLSRAETAEQLALLGADGRDADRIHARSLGQPLFTEQLAAHLDDQEGLPGLLADLLDRRLAGMSDAAWSVVRALGLAERPLPTDVLAEVSGLAPDDLTAVLRELRERRLLRTSAGDDAELRHPLLADAVRRRLVPGEGVATHRTLARALAARPAPEPAEVAEHWRRAGEPAEELGWRVAAARGAAARFDRHHEADHWVRALEIWPAERGRVGDPATSRAEAYVGAMDSLRASFRFDEAAALSEAAERSLSGDDLDDGERADLLFRQSILRGDPDDFASGLALLDEALALHEQLPVREGRVRILDRKQSLLFAMGRAEESRAVAAKGVEAARELGDPVLLRDALMRVAWHIGATGELERGLDLLARATAESGAHDDPLGDVRCGVYATDMLLTCGAPADDVVAAGRPALSVAATHDFDNPQVMLVRVNVAFSLLRAGRVAEAEDVAGSQVGLSFDADHWPLHTARAVVDVRRGHAEAGRRRIEEIWAEPSTSARTDLEFLVWAADVAYWTGAAEPSLEHLLAPLAEVAGTAPVRLVAPVLVAAARAAARLGRHDAGPELASLARRSGLTSPEHHDDRDLVAHRAALSAELAGLTGTQTVRQWADVAARWEALGRPHDAAYARWRAARVALDDGRGTVAARLLRQAAHDAREHVPLARAVDALA